VEIFIAAFYFWIVFLFLIIGQCIMKVTGDILTDHPQPG
jgi:hypothetical protein